MEFYQCVVKCYSGYSHPPKFCLACKFRSIPQILISIILARFSVSWWFQASLLDLKSCLCPHLYGARVIFGHRGYCLSCKGNVFLLQGNCVRMSGCHHIDMFHTHFTYSCHKSCYIQKSISYALWVVYVVSLSVCVWSQLSPIIVYICVNDLTFSHFLSNLASFSFSELCTLLLQPSSFLPFPLELHSVQRPQHPLASKTMQWFPPVYFP